MGKPPEIKEIRPISCMPETQKAIVTALRDACDAAIAAGDLTDETLSSAILALTIVAIEQRVSPLDQVVEALRLSIQQNALAMGVES